MRKATMAMFGCAAILAAGQTMGQDALPGGRPPPPGAAFDGRPSRGPDLERRTSAPGGQPESPSAAIRNALANPGLAAGLGLKPEQIQMLAQVDDETVARSISTALFIQILMAVIADPEVALRAGLTPAQIAAVEKNLTPALVNKNFSPAEVDSVVRAVLMAGSDPRRPTYRRP